MIQGVEVKQLARHANVRGARLGVGLRSWQEALAGHLQTSRSDSGATAPQVITSGRLAL